MRAQIQVGNHVRVRAYSQCVCVCVALIRNETDQTTLCVRAPARCACVTRRRALGRRAELGNFGTSRYERVVIVSAKCFFGARIRTQSACLAGRRDDYQATRNTRRSGALIAQPLSPLPVRTHLANSKF